MQLFFLPLIAAQCTVWHFNDVYNLSLLPAFMDLRSNVPNSITLFAGDILGGSKEGVYYKGRQAITVLNKLHIDASVCGNHDTDFGAKILSQRVQESQFPWLGANIQNMENTSSETRSKDIISHIYLPCGAFRLGILGLSTHVGVPRDISISEGTLEFFNTLEQMQDECDVIIALTHLNLEDDVRLARAVPKTSKLRLIAGGHDHFSIFREINQITIAKAEMNLRTVWSHTFINPSYFISKSHNLSPEAQPMHLSPPTHLSPPMHLSTEAKELQDMIQSFHIPENHSLIMALPTPLDTHESFIRFHRAPIGDLLTMAMRHIFTADCAILHSGFVRSDCIFENDLTWNDLSNMLPFNDVLIVVLMQSLKRLENIHKTSRGSGSFMCGIEACKPGRVVLPGYLLSGKDPTFDFLLTLPRENQTTMAREGIGAFLAQPFCWKY